MTAPFAPPPPWPVFVAVAAILAVAFAAPLGRRDDWIGWAAFVVVVAAALPLWGLLAWGLTRAAIRRWRDRSTPD